MRPVLVLRNAHRNRESARRRRRPGQCATAGQFHPIYHYAFVVDAIEGLIVVNVDTFADGEPRNNFLKRATTWNEGGVLKGGDIIIIASYAVYHEIELEKYSPELVYVDDNNRIQSQQIGRASCRERVLASV